MADSGTVLRRTASVRFRNVGGEGVIVHQAAGEIMAVNGTGALVFELADGKSSLEDIANEVADRYRSQDRKQVLLDVVTFAEQLVEAGALEAADGD